MNTRVCIPVVCFTVIMSAHLTIAIGGFEMELLMTKLDVLQNKLQEVEQNMQTTMEKMDHLQEKIEQIDSKFETKMHAMEESMKKSVKTSEDNPRAKFEDISNQLISKMDNILQQQVAETKTYQETLETELKKISENKNALDMLTDSVRNMSTLAEKSNKILEAHVLYPARSCRVMKLSGKYMINTDENTFQVLCEQNSFEGGWTVIQHRFNGSVDFYRGWTDYRNGFGALDGEFWLGLEYLHQMTKNRPHELMVEMKDFEGNYGYSKYAEFEIGNESEMYVLKKLGKYSGTGGDSMWENEGMMFTTFDRDNDKSNSLNCAKDHHGAWWFWSCSASNLNGQYRREYGHSSMSWYNFVGKWDWRALSYSRMMIRDIIN